MKTKNILLFSLIVTLLAFGLSSCKKNKEIIPSAEFAPYVSAYTGGNISSNAPIRIEFAQDVPMVELNEEIVEKLFDFSPKVKGKAYWVNSRTIEFVPDSGSLKQGELYNAEFALGKVMKVEKKLETFAFSFRVQEQNFVIETETVGFMTENDNKLAKVEGDIKFSDVVNIEQVKEMVTAELTDKGKMPVKIVSSQESKIFHFVVEDVQRSDKDRTLTVKVNGSNVGVKKTEKAEVLIPALDAFRYLEAKHINLPENGVEITFSEPLLSTQDLQGIISISEVNNYVHEINKNKVKIFFEPSDLRQVTLNIEKSVKSFDNKTLSKSSKISITIESLKPEVEFLNAGNILPDSKNLLLPFKAVNLWAVDLKIIKIFETNIPMFLQENTLGSSNNLRRSGRLVYKKTLRLDGDATRRTDRWSEFTVDLSKIIKQEPGAIYNIQLSFKQEYSLYPCDGAIPAKLTTEGLNTLSPEELDDEDLSEWDQTRPYYYSDYDDEYGYSWSDYNWEDRDNPCKPTYYMSSDRGATCNVLASNIGIIAKGNSDNKMWIAVNNILDTKPLDACTIKILNYQLQPIGTGKTDKNGLACIELNNGGKPFIACAEHGNEKAYLRLVSGEEKSYTRFDVSGKSVQKGLKGFFYGERGVWRPGDTIFLTFILEDKQKKIPEGHPVVLEVYNSRGQFYSKQVSTTGLNGFYAFKIPTQSDDPTGTWNAYAKVGGNSFHKSLPVETVKPNRLKINLSIPSTNFEVGKDITAKLSSNWLTGATAKNLKARVEMTLSRVYTQFKGYEEYEFNNPAARFYSEEINLFDGTLDEEGKASFDIGISDAENAPGMLRATFLSRVFEPGGDISTYVQTMPFSPFSSYVGLNTNLKNDYDFMETDKDYTFDVVNLSSDGKLVNGGDIEYTIYKLRWGWWWQSSYESFDSYINGSSAEVISSGKVNMTNGKGKIKFKVEYPEWGRYLVYVKNTNSGHATGKVIYMDWPEWRGRSQKDDPSGLTMLSFSTDKPSYEMGQEVTVILPKSAAKGKALVSIENGSMVLKQEWVDIQDKEDTKYKFKVIEQMLPNCYIHVSLLQPHAQTVNGLPIRLYGVVPITITDKNSELTPEITMPEVLRPEKEFTVKVKEKTGRAMTYTLAIVDDGLLDLTGFKTPNPWNEFNAREALGIKTWDMYDFVVGAFGGKFAPLLGVGGDEELKPSNSKANRFKPVVKFLGPFTLKKGQTASHNIKLPTYVGSVRTMVIAGQDGAYGKAEKTTPVRNPLMILTTLPRVISVGEEIALPVTVFAMENGVKDVTIKIETSGLLKPQKGDTRSFRFEKTGDQLVFFPTKAGNKTGVERVKITATGNGHTATETIEIQVRNPNPPIIRYENKLVGASTEETLSYNLGTQSTDNWAKLEVARIPSVDFNRRYDYLFYYDNLCSEQITSKAFPLLYMEQFKALTDKEKEGISKSIREAIKRLYGRQLSGGGFAYWSGQPFTNDWVSSYAGNFLIEAKQKGYEVSENVIKNWIKYQKKEAKNWTKQARKNTRYEYYQSDLEQAYRLYTLALAGSAEQGSMNKLKEMSNISLQTKWCLAAAYAIDGKPKIAKELVWNQETNIPAYSSNNSTYGSSLRDKSMILQTLVLLGETQKAFQVAQLISKELNNQYYFSTQSTAYALIAMARLAEKMSQGAIDVEWEINGKRQTPIKTAKPVYLIDLPTNVLVGNVKITNKGKGDVFVNLTSKSQPIVDTLPEIRNNLKAEVSYTDLKGQPLNITTLRQGTDFYAIVKVVNINTYNNYTDLALTHIIPSGWEIFNDRMMRIDEDGNPASSSTYGYKDIRDDRVLNYFDLSRNTYRTFKVRLNAAYAGRFLLPAVQSEAMYDTEAQARTRSQWIEVVTE